MKTITYKEKNTNASTTYMQFKPADTAWFWSALEEGWYRATEAANYDADLREVLNQRDRVFKRQSTPYAGTRDYNSINSLVAGMLKNRKLGTRDLSTHMIEPLESIFKVFNHFVDDIERIEFMTRDEFIDRQHTERQERLRRIGLVVK